MTDPHRPRLRLIRGGPGRELRLGPVRVVASPSHASPFPVDAAAAEEDTYLVLSAAVSPGDVKEPILKILTEVHEQEPVRPGTVVVRNTRPLKMLAVVHDLSRDPSWTEAWVTEATESVLAEAERRRVRSLALPMLGTVHGGLPPTRFMELAAGILRRAEPVHLRRLWIVTPEDQTYALFALLQSELRASAG